MVPTPTAVGLILCERTIIEEGTGKASLIGIFNRLTFESFPSKPMTFSVYALLTDGSGDATLGMTIVELETDEEVFASDLAEIHFSGKLKEVRLLARLEDWSFPAPGWYQFTLLIDGEWAAHKLLEVALEEEES